MSWRSLAGTLALSAIAGGCGAANVDAPEHTVVTSADPCGASTALRGRVDELVGNGRVERAVRVIEKANRLCPTDRPKTWASEVHLLAELGRYDDARALAGRMLAAADADGRSHAAATAAIELATERGRARGADKTEMRTLYVSAQREDAAGDHAQARELFVKAWDAWPNAASLYGAGRSARLAGDEAGAQVLFDRALFAFERETGATARVEAPSGFVRPTQVRWSPDGLWMVMGDGNEVVIIEAGTMREKLRVGVGATVLAVAVSPDGVTVGAGDSGGRVSLLSSVDGTSLRSMSAPVPGPITQVVFDRERWVASSVSGGVFAWPAAGGAEAVALRAPGGSPARSLARSDKIVAVGLEDGSIALYDGDRLSKTLTGHAAAVRALALSPDSTTLVSGSWDGVIRTWNLGATGEPRVTKGESPTSLAFSPDGARFAAGYFGGGTKVFDARSGEALRALDAGGASLDFSPHGTHLVTTGSGALFSSARSLVRVFRVSDGALQQEIEASGAPVRSIAVAGHALASASDAVRVWTLDEGRLLRPVKGAGTLSLAFTPDGQALAASSVDAPVGLFTIPRLPFDQGALQRRLPGETTGARGLAFSHDGAVLLVGSTDGYGPKLVRVASDSVVSVPVAGGQATENASALAPDAGMVAVGTTAGTVEVRSSTGEPLLPPLQHALAVRAVAFSPDSIRLATGSADGTAKIWNAGGDALSSLPSSGAEVACLAFSPDSSMLATGGSDGVVRIWSTARGAWLAVLTGHKQEVTALVFLDDRVLFSSSQDGTVRAWDVKKGEALAALHAFDGREAGYVLAPSGHVELVGNDPEAGRASLVCRIGTQSRPLDLCADRFLVKHLLPQRLSGDATYLEP